MSTEQQSDKEPKPSEIASSAAPKERRAFSKLRRELSDEELSSPGVYKLLLDSVDQLEQENIELKDYEDRYHEADKQCARCEERMRHNTATEVLYSVCLAVGFGLLGFSPSIWSIQPAGALLVVFGALLVIGGIITKIISK